MTWNYRNGDSLGTRDGDTGELDAPISVYGKFALQIGALNAQQSIITDNSGNIICSDLTKIGRAHV